MTIRRAHQPHVHAFDLVVVGVVISASDAVRQRRCELDPKDRSDLIAGGKDIQATVGN